VGCSRGFSCRFVHANPESEDELQLYYRMQNDPEGVIKELQIKANKLIVHDNDDQATNGTNYSIDLLGSMVVGVYDLRASNIGSLGCQK